MTTGSKGKVILVSFEFPPYIGGAGAVAQDYATYLGQQGSVVVLTSTHKDRKKVDEDYEIHSVKSVRKIQPIFFYRKFSTIYDESVTHIILNDAGACLMAALFFSEALKSKSIVFVHGSEDRKLLENQGLLFRLFKVRNRYLSLLRSCQLVIGVSEFLKGKFITKTRFPELANKFLVIRNSVNTEDIKCNHARPAAFNDPSKTILFSASRLVERKGYGNMLKLFREVIQIDDGFVWYIAGDGPYEPILREKIDNYGLNRYVKLLGAIEKEAIWSYYGHADCFWQLSDFQEGLGLVYLEAALCGCPVIGYNEGGIPEVVNNQTGILFNRGESDAIIACLLSKSFKGLNREVVMHTAQSMNQERKHLLLDKIGYKTH